MRWSGLLASALLLLPAAASGQPEEPFRPKGSYNNSVHRFHPDLDARLNAVRYGRWRALQMAWEAGVNPALDLEFAAYLRGALSDPPRFAPEAERVAPGPARAAAPIFRALRWGQTLEQEFLDILASADASPALTSARVDRAMQLYRRERYALSEPPEAVSGSDLGALAPESTAMLASGTKLFALAAADLASADFAEQRWKVRQTVTEFDPSTAAASPSDALYESAAAAVAAAYPAMAERLDRLARFRLEVFEALVSGGSTPESARLRDENLRSVARRYGLPVKGIGE